MPEPLKNLFDEAAIRTMAHHLASSSPDFNEAGFCDFALEGLEELELKQRSERITDALERHLPDKYPHAVNLMLESLDPYCGTSGVEHGAKVTPKGIRGWPVMPMAEYVARHGQDDLDLSLRALYAMTMRFTSELAIRPFLIRHEAPVLERLAQWATDRNHHVRRLVSEGTRPRLPWAIRLPQFIRDPSPILPLLDMLKDDGEEYVRRSVANNLNDISKDHPDLVAGIAKDWMRQATPQRTKLIRHGLRTLVKSGHTGAMEALGFAPPEVKLTALTIETPHVALGSALEFGIELRSCARQDQPLIIDYAVHHMKANGSTSPKVFKWKTINLKAGSILKATRRHPIRPITTRRYYDGQHRVELLINGQAYGDASFHLICSQKIGAR